MKIKLFPVFSDERLEAIVNGDSITINGENIDFAVIPDGYRLPAHAVDNVWMVHGTYIERLGGEIHMSIRFPVEWDSPEEVRAPETPIILDVKSGAVKFPSVEPVENDQP
ncbi:hypothetical protein ACWHY4_26870 [Pseudomonas sp. E2-15]